MKNRQHSQAIARKRKEMKLTQEDFASKLGIGRSTVADIERGRIGVSKRIKGLLLKNLSFILDQPSTEAETQWNYCPHCGHSLK